VISNEPAISMEDMDYLDYLRDCLLPKYNSVPWNYILKGSDDGVQRSESLSYWTLSIDRNFKY
jgi:hypothetical protein